MENKKKEEYELNDAGACVQRELYEELGLGAEDIEDLALRYVTLRRIKGEIRQNYFFFANMKEHVNDNPVSNEGICKWFSLEDMRSLEMLTRWIFWIYRNRDNTNQNDGGKYHGI